MATKIKSYKINSEFELNNLIELGDKNRWEYVILSGRSDIFHTWIFPDASLAYQIELNSALAKNGNRVLEEIGKLKYLK